MFDRVNNDINDPNAELDRRNKQKKEIQFYGIQVYHPTQIKDRLVIDGDYKKRSDETTIANEFTERS